MHRRLFLASLAAPLAANAIPRWASALATHPAPPRVNGERLNRSLAELARIGPGSAGGTNRVAYSNADREARTWVMQLMRAARLEPAIDAAGNIVARVPGSDPSLRPIVFGSHIDSVPNGGSYDGDVGSLAAIEVARTLIEQRITTRHPLEVAIWQNEEGGLVGSHGWIGDLSTAKLQSMTHSGRTVRDGIRFIGGDPDHLERARRTPGDIAAYLELHIEQGGTLDRERIDIGIVEGIVGLGWWEVKVTGFANHAGTTPMDQRQDALLAAARFIEMVNRVVTSVPGRQVGTVGRIQALPGASNVIAGEVSLSLELRDLDDGKIQSLSDTIAAESRTIAASSGTRIAITPVYRQQPALSDERVRRVIGDSARTLGLTTRTLPSGAGHDAQNMARLGPMGMIFVPSVGGISHAPGEFTKPADVVNGADVLLGAVLALDGMNADRD